MTLEEAIKILNTHLDQTIYVKGAPFQTALKLGVEASKRYQDLRSQRVVPYWELLPGETED